MSPKSNSKMVIVLLILLLVSAGFNYYLYSQSNGPMVDPQVAAQEEAAKLVKEVSKLILLPKDETPTVATVKDPEKLKDQVFFANAVEGSKVLIYTKAKKAIMYDPVNHKVLEVAPLNIGELGDKEPVSVSSDEL